jgi:hypothetical protein
MLIAVIGAVAGLVTAVSGLVWNARRKRACAESAAAKVAADGKKV